MANGDIKYRKLAEEENTKETDTVHGDKDRDEKPPDRHSCSCCCGMACKVTAVLVVLVVIGAVIIPYVVAAPLHAQCTINWDFPSVNCSSVSSRLVAQIKKWTTDATCPDGAGEKCLYKLISVDEKVLTATHTTPVKKYVDDLTFNFKPNGQECDVKGYSTSETWYAVLDSGTNYCNLHNLITGSALDKTEGYKEDTSDDVCTQYSSADCEKY